MHFPIIIGVRRSFFLCWALILIHAAAVVVLFLPAWPLFVPVSAGVLLCFFAWQAWRKSRPSIDALRLKVDGGLECRLAGTTDFFATQLLEGAVVHPLLICLHVVCDGRVHVLVILPDSATTDERRQLRIWLRWHIKSKNLASG